MCLIGFITALFFSPLSTSGIEELIQKNIVTIQRPHQLQEIYDQITLITDSVKENDAICHIWKEFLEEIQTKLIIYEDGSVHRISTQRQLDRLRGRISPVAIEVAEIDQLSQKKFDEIREIYQECFGKQYGGQSSRSFTEWLKKSPMHHVLAKDDQGKIVGVLSYEEQPKEIYICFLGKKATCSKMGIGSLLLKHLLTLNPPQIHLEVRKSNTSAIDFYKKFGFQCADEVKDFYSNPSDDGWIMNFQSKQKNIVSQALHVSNN